MFSRALLVVLSGLAWQRLATAQQPPNMHDTAHYIYSAINKDNFGINGVGGLWLHAWGFEDHDDCKLFAETMQLIGHRDPRKNSSLVTTRVSLDLRYLVLEDPAYENEVITLRSWNGRSDYIEERRDWV